MSNMLKCPNPTCPYVFDPSLVPVGVVLSCPRCGMQFTLGPPAPTAASSHPSGGAATAPPASRPEPSHPDFEAVGRTAVQERDRDPDAPPPGQRTNSAQVYIYAGIASVLMAGTILTLFFMMRRGESVPASTVTQLTDRNVGVDTAPPHWKTDDTMRVKVGSPFILAYKREDPEAYVAFGANEPAVKGRSPRLSDMRADLRLPFPKLFELDTLNPQAPVATSWLGEMITPAHGFQFRVQSTDGLNWEGEAYTVAHKGIAYYWLSWCGEKDYEVLKDEFATFRSKFKLLQARNDWRETQSNVIDYKGDKVHYTISDAEELWKEVPTEDYPALKTAEPDLDRRLRASRTPKRDRTVRPDTAELSVYVLDGGGDPLQEARKYAEQMETARIKTANAELTPPTFKELTDKLQGDAATNSLPANMPYVRLESNVKESINQNRLIVVSGLKVGDKTVIVHCWCEAKKREIFEPNFVQIASSLR